MAATCSSTRWTLSPPQIASSEVPVVVCGVLTHDSTPAEVTLYYLEDAVRSLAQPADIQQQLFAENPLAGGEMAVDFDAWYVPAVRDGYLADWAPKHCQALEKIDRLLTEMRALQNIEVWTSGAVASSSWWAIVRAAAQEALLTLQWSPDPPGSVQNKTIKVMEPQE